MKLQFDKTTLAFGAIFLLIVSIRFLWLDSVPPGMQHDEIEYVLSSKTYQMFGSDLSGVTFPQSLIATRTLGAISPIPPLILSPFWSILPLNLWTVRMAYTVLNILTAIVFGFLVQSLLKNKRVTFLAIALFLINPWSLFFSRQAIDAAFALFFFLLGMHVLIEQKKWYIPLSFMSFFLGFFSYNGAKILLVPIVFTCLGYIYLSRKKSKQFFKELILYGLLTCFLLGGFILASKILPGSVFSSRSSEIIFLNQDYIASHVNDLRKIVIATPFTNLYINKATVAVQYFVQQYLGALSLKTLFSTGEVFRYHGYFYLPEALLLCFGLIRIFLTKKRIFYFLSMLLLISPIVTASSMNGESILNRSFLLLPLLLIFIAYGIEQSMEFLKKFFPSPAITISFIGIYLFLFSRLLFTYFFQLPIHEHGFYQVATRVLARYVALESPHAKEIYVISKEPRQLYLETLFFSRPEIQSKLLQEKQTFVDSKKYSIGNIHFLKGCPTTIDPQYNYVISNDFVDCFPKIVSTYLILDQIDAAETFRIAGGVACRGVPLTRWRGNHLLSDYSIENLSDQQFCERWIAQPDP